MLADRRLARRRLPTASVRPVKVARVDAARSSGAVELAALCDSVARSLRSGRAAAEAVIEGLDRMDRPSSILVSMRRRLAEGESLTGVISLAADATPVGSDEGLFIDLLSASIVGSSMAPAGVEHASTTLRDIASVRSDLDVASSQARLSARVLTLLPIVVVFGGLVTSGSFRASLASRGVLVPLLVGLALTRLGWLWIVRMIDAVVAGASRIELTEIVDRVCVSLMVGLPLPEACERLADRRGADVVRGGVPSVGDDIAARIRQGRSLGDALEPLATTYGLRGRLFADLLVSAERDGLPVVASVSRVAQDVRAERRRRVDSAIRRIPVRLTMPLVLCILPGFLLTTLVPLVAASLDTLTVTLPDVLSPLGS